MSIQFAKLYKKDQEAITKWSEDKLTDKEFYKINKILRKEISKLLKTKKQISGKDYFISAIIFHHNYKLTTSKKAVKLAKTAYEKEYKKRQMVNCLYNGQVVATSRKTSKIRNTSCEYES